MSIRRLADGTPIAGDAANTEFATSSPPMMGFSNGNATYAQRQAQGGGSVMPMGPDVDVNSILGPLIDGSFSQAQGQAAIMAGVKAPQAPGTVPMRGTAPLGGTDPLTSPAPAQPTAAPNGFGGIRVPPKLVQQMVDRVLSGMP